MHPYKNLPPDRFWNRSVSDHAWSDIDFKPDSKFKLDGTERIATAGSCFAQHIARNLGTMGLNHLVAEKPSPVLTAERSTELQYGIFSARYGNIYTAGQSPVALAATATDDHVLSASSLSKSVLRAVTGEICASHPHCDYFPSYEICSSAANFGQYLDSDLRNISPRGVKQVMKNFEKSLGRDHPTRHRQRAGRTAGCVRADKNFAEHRMR